MKEFNRRDWNKRMSDLIKEHPELRNISGKINIELFTDKGSVLKVRIIDKEI